MNIDRATLWNRRLPLGAILLAAFPALAGHLTYTYDTLDRLTRVVDGDGTVIDYRYDATGNRTSHIVQAAAAAFSLTLAKAGAGSGTVAGEGRYAAGAAITLTATADASSTFAGWSPSPCAASFSMPANDLTCTATFNPNRTLRINDVSKAEGNTGTTAAAFKVTLSSASTSPVTVNYATANGSAKAGSDYAAASGTLTFAAGQTSKTVKVNLTGDKVKEANETFLVHLTAPAGATVSDSQGQGTLLNDDGPVLRINDVSQAEGYTGTTNATFTVTLSPASTSLVTVNHATANGSAEAGSDYTAVSGTLTFKVGQTSKTLAVKVVGDKVKEANETFLVNLSAPSGATLFDAQGLGTILNED